MPLKDRERNNLTLEKGLIGQLKIVAERANIRRLDSAATDIEEIATGDIVFAPGSLAVESAAPISGDGTAASPLTLDTSALPPAYVPFGQSTNFVSFVGNPWYSYNPSFTSAATDDNTKHMISPLPLSAIIVRVMCFQTGVPVVPLLTLEVTEGGTTTVIPGTSTSFSTDTTGGVVFGNLTYTFDNTVPAGTSMSLRGINPSAGSPDQRWFVMGQVA